MFTFYIVYIRPMLFVISDTCNYTIWRSVSCRTSVFKTLFKYILSDFREQQEGCTRTRRISREGARQEQGGNTLKLARTAGYIELFWVKTWNVIHIHNLFIMYLYQCDICIKTSTKEVKINCCENKDFCYIISKIVFIIFIKIYWISSLVSQIMVITLNKEWH